MSSYKKNNLFGIPLLAAATLLSVFVIFNTMKTPSQKLITNYFEETSGTYNSNLLSANFWGNNITVPKEIKTQKTNVLGDTSNDSKWIEVDLSEQKLKAWDGNNLYLESLVSTGMPWWPTPKGEFRIWYKVKYTRMKGGEGKYAYNLPNVPYTMFFENAEVPGKRGYGLHGTYWHNDFGQVHSHGCVNLPTPVAEKLYYWTTPVLGETNAVRSSAENVGTRIVIHE